MRLRRRYMSNLNIGNRNSEYNKEPVFYCKHCLSLNIRHIPRIEDSEYCDECGATSIAEGSIEDWESLYIQKYIYIH